MAGHKLEHFQFSDPISKEAASRTTRYRLLKKRRSDEYQTSDIPPEGIEAAEQELIDGNESAEIAELAQTNSCIAASDNEANPSNIHGEDSDVNLPVDPVTAYDNESESDESDEDNRNSPIVSDDERRVFEDCPLTESSSNLLILNYSIRHNLTLQATSDLLDLLRLHCPVSNTIPSSLHRFYNQLPKLNYPTTLHYFCSSCLQLVPSKQIFTCPNISCGKLLSEFRALSSFIELPLEEQIVNLMERKYIFLVCRTRKNSIL